MRKSIRGLASRRLSLCLHSGDNGGFRPIIQSYLRLVIVTYDLFSVLQLRLPKRCELAEFVLVLVYFIDTQIALPQLPRQLINEEWKEILDTVAEKALQIRPSLANDISWIRSYF